ASRGLDAELLTDVLSVAEAERPSPRRNKARSARIRRLHSLRQSRFAETLCISRHVLRAAHGGQLTKIGNAQRWIDRAQPHHCLPCNIKPPSKRIAGCGH